MLEFLYDYMAFISIMIVLPDHTNFINQASEQSTDMTSQRLLFSLA